MKSRIVPALVGFSVAFAGCSKDEAKPDGTTSRSDSILAPPGAATTATPTASSTVARPVATGASQALCASDLARPGHPFGKVPLAIESASGATPPPDPMPVGASGGGKWTWINLFAGWCGPCKEEIPRLESFASKLAAAGTPINLAFVSVDDDQRQLDAFLAAQPASGVRSAYWSKDGAPRQALLAATWISDPPTLPTQIFVDPLGQIRCVASGGIVDADFPAVSAIAHSK